MIKNIVFDIGNVLVEYFPSKEIEKLKTNEDKIKEAKKLLSTEVNYRKYLNGLISLDELLDDCNSKYKGFNVEFDLLLSKDTQKYLMHEIEPNTKLLENINKKYVTYLLSNIAKEPFEYIYENFKFAKIVKGGVYSYVEHMSKPEPKIYERLIERYNLIPEETIFIDDKIKNVEEAEKLGIKGILYKKEDDLRKLLEKEGIEIEHTGDNC